LYGGGPEPLALDPGNVSFVQEKSYSPFVTVRHELRVADMPLIVSGGLRYERTNVITAGFERLPTGMTVSPADHTGFTFQYTPLTYLTARNQYSYFLPSLDLNFLPLPGLKLRFDASRTLTRPPQSEIAPTLTAGGRVGALT